MRNKQVVLASRPRGWVEESNFRVVEKEVPPVRKDLRTIEEELGTLRQSTRAA